MIADRHGLLKCAVLLIYALSGHMLLHAAAHAHHIDPHVRGEDNVECHAYSGTIKCCAQQLLQAVSIYMYSKQHLDLLGVTQA